MQNNIPQNNTKTDALCNDNRVISVKEGGLRLDSYLTTYFGGAHTRSQIANAITSGNILLNGKKVKCGTLLKDGDIIVATIKSEPITAKPENIKLEIVYEDEYLQIINKPRGLVVHPGAGNKSGTLLNGLLFRAQENGNKVLERAGIVHRLDKSTAGLLVVAKTEQVQSALAKMFERHEVKREYLALVEGELRGNGVIDKNIIRHPKHRTLFTTTESKGRRAISNFEVLTNYIYRKKHYSLVRFSLLTGRTHQIRVHAKSINKPIVSDPEYNPHCDITANGQLLESVHIAFTHPVTNKLIDVTVPLTYEFQCVLNKMTKV